MTPTQSYRQLESILVMLDRLFPAFHTVEDRQDMSEAQMALQAVCDRLARDIEESERCLPD
jgi:hypothetical protein